MKARDIMSSPVITISVHGTVGQAADVMDARDISCLPITNADGTLVGIITASDFGLHPKMMLMGGHLYTLMGETVTTHDVEALARQLRGKPVRGLGRQTPITVQEDMLVEDVMEVMLENKVHHVPVLKGGILTGIITQHDFLKLYKPD